MHPAHQPLWLDSAYSKQKGWRERRGKGKTRLLRWVGSLVPSEWHCFGRFWDLARITLLGMGLWGVYCLSVSYMPQGVSPLPHAPATMVICPNTLSKMTWSEPSRMLSPNKTFTMKSFVSGCQVIGHGNDFTGMMSVNSQIHRVPKRWHWKETL